MENCTRLFILSFSDMFFAAYSDAKLILFFVALGIFFLVKRVAGKRILATRIPEKRFILWIYILVGVLGISGIVSFAYTAARFDVPITRTAVLADNGIYTTFNGIFHYHTMKPVVTWLLIPLGLGDVKTYGSALPFWTVMQEMQAWYIGLFILLCILLVSMTVVGITESKKRKNLWFDISYVIFSYGLVKVLIDGGVLWYEAHVYVLFYSLLLFIPKQRIPLTWKTVSGITFGALLYGHVTHILMRLLYSPTLTADMLFGRYVLIYALTLACLALWFATINLKKIWWVSLTFIVIAYVIRTPASSNQKFIQSCLGDGWCNASVSVEKTRQLRLLSGNPPQSVVTTTGAITTMSVEQLTSTTYLLRYTTDECSAKTGNVLVEFLTTQGVERFLLL